MLHWNKSEKIFSRHFSQKREFKSSFFSLSLRLDFLERPPPQYFTMLSVSLAHAHLSNVHLCRPLAAIGLRKIRIFRAFPHHFYGFPKKKSGSTLNTCIISHSEHYNICFPMYFSPDGGLFLNFLPINNSRLYIPRAAWWRLWRVRFIQSIWENLIMDCTENELGTLLARDSGVTRPECACV